MLKKRWVATLVAVLRTLRAQLAREYELLAEFERVHHRLPRFNLAG